MTAAKAESADPVEIMANAMSKGDYHGGDTLLSMYARSSLAALEAAGFRIVHPERVTERMASAAGEEVLAQYSACMHWEEAKDVVEGLDDASVISVAIAAAPTYAAPAAPQKE